MVREKKNKGRELSPYEFMLLVASAGALSLRDMWRYNGKLVVVVVGTAGRCGKGESRVESDKQRIRRELPPRGSSRPMRHCGGV